jgi:predicted deacylase
MGRTTRWVDVATLASGASLRLALHEIVGTRGDGPTLGISALIHGDEIVGLEVIRRIIAGTDPTKLRGRLLLLPVANPLAFEALTRNTPLAVEVGNLNRVFPGDAAGDLVGRLADVLAREFVGPITHLIDLHGGGTHPLVDYGISLYDLEFGLSFGMRLVRETRTYAGTMGALAGEHGKPTFVPELGGGYVVDERYIEMGVRGIRNVLMRLEMIDGHPALPEEQLVVETVVGVRPGHGGLLIPALSMDALGSEVPAGTVLGRVISPYTFETLEELRAPFERSLVVLLRPALTRVNPGDYAYMLADAGEMRRIRNSLRPA